ncbi:MAG: prepilin-type N-terminal cleavage/methylation domain-containing protein [Planctomycetaceae bacterium]|nr:prepilin-type N-terminal cleavage/methylation domain-containing protein [Planctomycetaceae bacterium]
MSRTITAHNRKRAGFSLIELVVVVLVMGILAAVAGPKMFDTASDARLSGTKQSLSVVRDAIELYRAQNGAYPSSANSAAFQTDMSTYLRGTFPQVQVGANKGSNAIRIHSGSPTPSGTEGWAYDTSTGSFIINDATSSYNTL